MTEPERVDVVVVGLGVGGEEVAGRLAQAGLSVVGVERRLVGGECPYWGCIPSKMMIRAGNALAEAHRVDGLAGRARVEPDWAPVAARIRAVATADWDDTAAVDRFTGKGGRFVRGTGTLDGPGRVRVGDRIFAADRGVVIGTGTTAVAPPIDGLAGTPYWTNREAIEAKELPTSLVILGGGAIGLELAQVFVRFGVRVTVIEPGGRVLAAEEPESSELAAEALRADGVRIHTGVRPERVVYDEGGFTVHLREGESVRGDRLLVATGRAARLGGLGLASVGVDPGQRSLAVDDRLRVLNRPVTDGRVTDGRVTDGRAGDERAGDGVSVTDGLWAVGDVTGRGPFTHTAMYQADVAVRDILRRPGPPADYTALPRVTFVDPEIGAVGLTERQARDRGLAVEVGVTSLSGSARGFIYGPGNAGFIKVVADADRGVLVGATSAGPSGGEVLGALTVAVRAAVPVEMLRHTMWAYPTFHRAIGEALGDLR